MSWRATLKTTAWNHQQIPSEADLEIAFVGRSNVGKSSLLNRLIGQKLAHVSSKPGKTRSINFYQVEGSASFTLVDLPGFGYAKRSKDEQQAWSRLIADYITKRSTLTLIVHLVDLRHGLLEKDRIFQEWSRQAGVPLWVVFTKADKISRGKRGALIRNYVQKGLISWDKPLACSIEEPATIDAVRSFLENFLVKVVIKDEMEGYEGDDSK